jgi:hypothetical protein
MTLDDMDLMLEQIEGTCKDTHRDLVTTPGQDATMVRIKLLALASHCVSARRIVEDLRTGPVAVLGSHKNGPSS